jgi:PAS domain S-box-containing protein
VLVIAAPVCALLLAMVVFYQFERQLHGAQAGLERTTAVRSSLREVLIEMINAETGIRGYLLSGRPAFLQPYENARRNLPQLFADLDRRALPEQAAQVTQVRQVAQRLIASFEKAQQDTRGGRAPQSLVYLEDDKAGMDQLRALLGAMQAREQELMAEQTRAANEAEARLRAAILGGGALGLLGGFLAVVTFTKRITRRIRHLEVEAQEVAAGRPITHEVAGNDEISRLEQTLKATSEKLHSTQQELERRMAQQSEELAVASEGLREANEVREAVIRSSPLAIWAVDLDGTVRLWNPAAQEIFGWSEEEVLGKPLPVVPAEQKAEYERWMAGFQRGEMISGQERKRQRKDGRLIDVAIWTAPLRSPDGSMRGTIAIDSDVSHRKLLEEQFRQAQKLEAVGRLAGGVAHDFNNLLTIIQGYTEMIVMETEEHPDLLEYAHEIQYASERASALTTQLLAFSRRQISQPRILDLNEVLAHSMKMLRRIIGEDIEITSHLEADLGKVKADPVHIDQVIMNLAVNARDAMPNGGRIVLETANARLDADYVERHIGVTAGAYTMLAVSDNGTGMSAETKSRLFEPFFTTKDAGKGTGLGLAIVYGIVKQANGEIMVYSEPGKGTTFKIYLPMMDQPASFAAKGRQQQLRGSETVLVCEDDAKIRRLVDAMLTRQGYRVLVAENPDQALDTVRQWSGTIDLLLTDIVMPRISGFELAKAVGELRPGTRVLYMSGYTDNHMSSSWVLDEDVPFIQKPFTAAALTEKVREALGENGAGRA